MFRGSEVPKALARLVGPSGHLGDVYTLSGELRNELDLKRTGPLQIFATVNDWIVS